MPHAAEPPNEASRSAGGMWHRNRIRSLVCLRPKPPSQGAPEWHSSRPSDERRENRLSTSWGASSYRTRLLGLRPRPDSCSLGWPLKHAVRT
jgi:hypothetical protein